MVVAALVVVNAVGDIVDWRTGTIVAGARTTDGRGFARTVDVLAREVETRRASAAADEPLRATTLAVIATNVALSKTQLTKLAQMANTAPCASSVRITRKATAIRFSRFRLERPASTFPSPLSVRLRRRLLPTRSCAP